MSQYFQKSKFLGANLKVELDLSNYATKADFKNAGGADTSKVAKMVDLASLKSEFHKLDIDKLEKVPTGLNSLRSKVNKLDVHKLVHVPVDLSKLSGVVKNDVVKKTEYDEFVKNVNAIQTTGTSNLVKKTDYNIKINEIEKRIADNDHSNIYITTQEFNKFTADNFVARLARANVASKNDIAAFVWKTDFDDKLKKLSKKAASNKTKHREAEKKTISEKGYGSMVIRIL